MDLIANIGEIVIEIQWKNNNLVFLDNIIRKPNPLMYKYSGRKSPKYLTVRKEENTG